MCPCPIHIHPIHATVLLVYLGDWVTVHRIITLVDLQLDAQNSHLFTYNTFIKILYKVLLVYVSLQAMAHCGQDGQIRLSCRGFLLFTWLHAAG
jgi:hypothetical protein